MTHVENFKGWRSLNENSCDWREILANAITSCERKFDIKKITQLNADNIFQHMENNDELGKLYKAASMAIVEPNQYMSEYENERSNCDMDPYYEECEENGCEIAIPIISEYTENIDAWKHVAKLVGEIGY